jgi:hypothetical protein
MEVTYRRPPGLTGCYHPRFQAAAEAACAERGGAAEARAVAECSINPKIVAMARGQVGLGRNAAAETEPLDTSHCLSHRSTMLHCRTAR